ncbi:hypothetical protein COCVIDRAFT_116409, partial [Bipolaris victoriae FI3]
IYSIIYYKLLELVSLNTKLVIDIELRNNYYNSLKFKENLINYKLLVYNFY